MDHSQETSARFKLENELTIGGSAAILGDGKTMAEFFVAQRILILTCKFLIHARIRKLEGKTN